MEHADVIVLGVGAMGAAACWQLAERGKRVIGIEQFGLGHDRGSSHGETRIIRRSYFEHPDYVPLLNRAYEMWGQLEEACGARLFHRSGLLMLGPPEGDVIRGVLAAAEKHGIDLQHGLSRDTETYDGGYIHPGFRLSPGHTALFEEDAGYLEVEKCVTAMWSRAEATGAKLRSDEAVLDWRSSSAGVEVQTSAANYLANRLIITAGAWSGALLRLPPLKLDVMRRVQLWFQTYPVVGWTDRVQCLEYPAFCVDEGERFFYGMPSPGRNMLKVALHHGRRDVVDDPSHVDRSLRPGEADIVEDFVRRTLHGVTPRAVEHSVCMYTMSQDGHFVIDRHPEHENVAFAAGFSGHGFKFAPVIGSILADLALTGTTSEPIGFLRLR
ncbi:MAG: oxidoreductase [Planctomycetota bacterium]